MVSRRAFIHGSACALACGALGRVSAVAQTRAPDMPSVPTAFEDLRRNVGTFTGRGGTIGWLATPEGVIVVDAQFPDTARICLEGLQQRAPKGIQVLINTHYHGDHTSGNLAFRPAVKSIVQQERCAKLHRDFTARNNTVENQAYSDVTFGESWSATIGDENVWATYDGAAHTGGDAVIVFEKANVVHMGDLMFNRLHPRVDRPGGASIANWMRILERTAAKHKDATFIFGHAKPGLPVTGPAGELLHMRDYFEAALERVRKEIAAGRSQEEIVGIETLPKFEDHVSAGQILTLRNTLTSAYEEITSKSR